ncbi:MAG: polysaccharide biosynthesis protein, partial [Bacteroidales bacterium]|nr:polysaccharide biosynthesis protein [Bacteroidales bacterium]
MPRWLIFLIDMGIITFSVFLAYMLRFNFHVPDHEIKEWPKVFALVLGVRGVSFLISKTYAGIIRFTSTEDAIRIFLVNLSGSIIFTILNLISFYFINESHLVPFSVVIIEFMAATFAMVTFRILVKVAYLELLNPGGRASYVIIFGAGEAGIITKRSLERDVGTKYKILAFIDDDKNKQGKKLEGINIYAFDKLESLLDKNRVEMLIIAVQKLKAGKKQDIVDVCLPHETRVLSVPPVSNWINGQLSFNQIRQVKIEDLLQREEIRLDVDKVGSELKGKRILITGAAGSIGSELTRQILNFEPAHVALIDQAESAMFDLEIELNEQFKDKPFEIAIADICNEPRMKRAFEVFKPELVYHAAAYKHVPMMENNPAEALFTNVKGTKMLADLSVQNGVEKFIMISTDKAVNPTNVMGASKRIAEMYTQALDQNQPTKFITTRFGNVLGSNGSAVNLFRRQIENGGPVTV